MKKRMTLLLALFFVINTVMCQKSKYGIGLFYPPLLNVDLDYTGVPFNEIEEYEIELYSEPGIVSGKCLISEKDQAKKNVEYYLLDGGGDKIALRKEDGSFIWISPKIYVLTYDESKNGFVKVKLNRKTYWLKKSNLLSFGYGRKSWRQYLQYTKEPLETIYNMNIRTEPNKNADKIGLTKVNGKGVETYHSIRIVGGPNKQWLGIEIAFWRDRKACCRNEKSLTKKRGWIKYIDDDGSPNLLNQVACLPE